MLWDPGHGHLYCGPCPLGYLCSSPSLPGLWWASGWPCWGLSWRQAASWLPPLQGTSWHPPLGTPCSLLFLRLWPPFSLGMTSLLDAADLQVVLGSPWQLGPELPSLSDAVIKCDVTWSHCSVVAILVVPAAIFWWVPYGMWAGAPQDQLTGVTCQLPQWFCLWQLSGKGHKWQSGEAGLDNVMMVSQTHEHLTTGMCDGQNFRDCHHNFE